MMIIISYAVIAFVMVLAVLAYQLHEERQVTVEGLGVAMLVGIIWPIGIVAGIHILMTDHANVVLFKLKSKK